MGTNVVNLVRPNWKSRERETRRERELEQSDLRRARILDIHVRAIRYLARDRACMVAQDGTSMSRPQRDRPCSALCLHYVRTTPVVFPHSFRDISTVFPRCSCGIPALLLLRSLSASFPRHLRSLSALFPRFLRTVAAVLPHCSRGISALLSQSFRTVPAVSPHSYRSPSAVLL